MELSIQNWITMSAFKKETVQAEVIAEAGFKYADWDLTANYTQKKFDREKTISHYKELKCVCDTHNLNIWMTHTLFPTYMDDSNRDEVMESIRNCFLATNILGAKYTVVHPMMPKKWEGAGNRELRVKENIAFYNSLAPIAKEYDITICIENMFGFPAGIGKYNETACSRYEEMLDIFNGLEDKECFGFCFDSGHANMLYKKNITDEIYALGKDIKVVHLHDNNDKFDFHQMPYKGNIDWDKVMKALSDVGFDGVYNFEVAPPSLKGFNKRKKMHEIHSILTQFLAKYSHN